MHRRFARSCFCGKKYDNSDDDKSEVSNNDDEEVEQEYESYIFFTRATAAMSMSPRKRSMGG